MREAYVVSDYSALVGIKLLGRCKRGKKPFALQSLQGAELVSSVLSWGVMRGRLLEAITSGLYVGLWREENEVHSQRCKLSTKDPAFS